MVADHGGQRDIDVAGDPGTVRCVELSITEVAEEGTIDLLPQPRHFALSVSFPFSSCFSSSTTAATFSFASIPGNVFIADDSGDRDGGGVMEDLLDHIWWWIHLRRYNGWNHIAVTILVCASAVAFESAVAVAVAAAVLCDEGRDDEDEDDTVEREYCSLYVVF